MAYTYEEVLDKKPGHVKEIEFFSSAKAWRARVEACHPGARIEADAAGVLRAYVGPVRVGVFGKLPGFGNITSLDVARYFTVRRKRNGVRVRTHTNDTRSLEERQAAHSAAMKAGWIKRRARAKAKAEQGRVTASIRRLRAV